MSDEFGTLADELREIFAGPWMLADEDFEALALRVFAYQFTHNAAYGAFCRGRRVTPDTVDGWRDIPAVPTAAFKEIPIFCGDPGGARAVFRTSGTTRGGESRGRHYVKDPTLYSASALPNARRHLMAGLEGPADLVALVPPPSLAPESSLSHMAGLVAEHLCSTAHWCAAEGGALDPRSLDTALDAVAAEGRPVLLFGTAFAYVHWLDHLDSGARAVPLPAGSRIMETGGFKGRSREVPRTELYGALVEATGVPTGRIVNEYGMTELLSQFYEPVLLGTDDSSSAPEGDALDRRHVGPPWMRTRILDPVTLEPVPDDSVGILAHYDLANLGSVCAVLTEDRGVRVGDGFRLRGRTPGSEPRGCSLTMEEFLRAREVSG